MKSIGFAFLILFPVFSYSQIQDSVRNLKWINYNRKRDFSDKTVGYYERVVYKSANGDTLLRLLAKNSITKEVLYESSCLHGLKNGLSIYYHPNGIIKEISYFLDGKIWETIYRADSAGKFLNPGSLHNGSGTKFFYDFYLTDPDCYETYKNGLPEGPFYTVNGLGTGVKGNLAYKPASAIYLPAKRVSYIDSRGDSSTEVFYIRDFQTLFNDSSGLGYKVLSIAEDSIIQLPKIFNIIEIGFEDPAIIPTGNWQLIDLKTKKQRASIDYDANGNVIKLIRYRENGQILSQQTFPPCKKQKVLKVNPDGIFFGEFCEFVH